MITLQNVSRWYGQVIGLNDVNCTIGPGLTALLGQNGAGKSTLMRLVTGQIKPTTGELKVFGMEPFANPEVYRRLGYCPEIDNFYEHYSGRDFVRFLARLDGMSASEAKIRTEEVIAMVGMSDRANRKIQGYSKGMRQRIKLAQAMLHNPDIILLDEPLNGLDPVGRREFIDVLGGLAAGGKCIVVSSHILFEVEQMTRSILLLHRGRLLATGDLRDIRDLIDKHPHKIRIETDNPRRAAELLAPLPNVVSMSFDRKGDALQLEVRDPNSFYDSLSGIVLEKQLEIRSFSSPDNNLESVFKYLVEA
ncbi:ABC transporter ATP-binding protein [Fimbriimonas ginsengisoli]|uniref:ABC transporter, ATP-binding protein NosF n=1 Tax=Fimbriimonas ginsengisoli Gsoil 348 TaxID=661478 RepID=A0A068NVQ8_FIMGI|nr:ABC transporter ATP-binding protein [Fimbriimonas ginsengisoli]AIE85679.1 ABC transporter, ATP-binding protein NosF [Fimbriimonas ginsengisoli Gsoil 348]